MKFADSIKRALLFVSETFFPADEMTKRLETMSVEDLLRDVRRLSASRELKGVTALFDYQDPLVNHAIRALKFRGNERIAGLLALALYEDVLEELCDRMQFEHFEKPLLIPMPSSGERLRERGWNQCELVARELIRLDRGAHFTLETKALAKNRFTESQIGKTRAERLANLADSFSIRDAALISGRNIILLDDVVTTGATMSEAKKTLLSSGARKVWRIAIAH